MSHHPFRLLPRAPFSLFLLVPHLLIFFNQSLSPHPLSICLPSPPHLTLLCLRESTKCEIPYDLYPSSFSPHNILLLKLSAVNYSRFITKMSRRTSPAQNGRLKNKQIEPAAYNLSISWIEVQYTFKKHLCFDLQQIALQHTNVSLGVISEFRVCPFFLFKIKYSKQA